MRKSWDNLRKNPERAKKHGIEDIFMAEKIGTLDQNEINKMKDNFKCLLFE